MIGYDEDTILILNEEHKRKRKLKKLCELGRERQIKTFHSMPPKQFSGTLLVES